MSSEASRHRSGPPLQRSRFQCSPPTISVLCSRAVGTTMFNGTTPPSTVLVQAWRARAGGRFQCLDIPTMTAVRALAWSLCGSHLVTFLKTRDAYIPYSTKIRRWSVHPRTSV